MSRVFNTTGLCVPEKHYMVNVDGRLQKIKALIDDGKYFVINRPHQYGKTTTLAVLVRFLKEEYYVVSMDFQTISNAKFEKEQLFCPIFAKFFLKELKKKVLSENERLKNTIAELESEIRNTDTLFELSELFGYLADICEAADKPVVLLIDEIDSASNNQVFLDFLAQIRAQVPETFSAADFSVCCSRRCA